MQNTHTRHMHTFSRLSSVLSSSDGDENCSNTDTFIQKKGTFFCLMKNVINTSQLINIFFPFIHSFINNNDFDQKKRK